MKIAAYQAPLLPNGSMEALTHIQNQIAICEEQGVEILCCPETIFGGWAEYLDNPYDVALNVEKGQLEEFLAPLASDTVSIIVGFTETNSSGQLYNTAAVLNRGKVIGLYRKVYPARNWSYYTAGDQLPTFTVNGITFGIIICNDTNYIEPARVIASKGAQILFIPTNNCVESHRADPTWVTIARNKYIAKAVENGITVVSADVAGHQGDYTSHGSTTIVDPMGQIIASSKLLSEDLLIAEIDFTPPNRFLRWDSAKNPAIVQAYRESCYADVKPYVATPVEK